MPIIRMDIPPGVYSHGAPLDSKGRWISANFVRWTNGSPQPVGGWDNLRYSGSNVQIDASTEDIMRGAHSWNANDESPYAAFGSASKLYAMNAGGQTFDITPTGFSSGIGQASENLAYGGKTYGSGAYGVARERDYSLAPATNWTLDNWGEYLVGCSDGDGKLYEWQLNTSNPAAVIANAPTNNIGLIVTAERFVFALGAGGNPRLIQWCDREDNTTWSPTITNEAGDLELQTTGSIVSAHRVRSRTLILTSQDAFVANYQGPPTVYGFQKVGDSCGSISRNAAASVGTVCFWMGDRNFFIYDGSVARVLPCEVHDEVFLNLDAARSSHIFCVSNQKFNEIWWFYPASGSEENNRYVAYDYQENHWTVGELGRSSGFDVGAFNSPIYIDESGYIYRHETGYYHGGSAPYVESGPINIADGDNVMRVTEMLPEESTQGQMEVLFKTRFYPNDTEYTYGPFNPSNPTSVRFTGRQVRMKVTGDDGVNWRFGDIRLRVSNGGQR